MAVWCTSTEQSFLVMQISTISINKVIYIGKSYVIEVNNLDFNDKCHITDGFNLPVPFIHQELIWKVVFIKKQTLLKNSYYHSLEIAKKYQCESVAFPLISAGIYGYPKEEALQISVSTISPYLLQHDMLVYLIVFDKASFGLSQKLFTIYK